jgi:hypothetical protein
VAKIEKWLAKDISQKRKRKKQERSSQHTRESLFPIKKVQVKQYDAFFGITVTKIGIVSKTNIK